MTEPIIEFKSLKDAYVCLHEWQERLFLNDWIIKLYFCDSIIDDNENELSGQNVFQIVNKACVVKLCNLTEDTKSRIGKISQEQVLVHELLHCKYNWLCPPQTMEGKYFEELEHGLIEQMAKSLIMAKYNIPFNWFVNFSEDSEAVTR